MDSLLKRGDSIVLSAVLTAGFLFMFFVNSSKIDSVSGDQLVYNQLALNLLAGNGFSQSVEPPFLPSVVRTPAFPLFLAGIYALCGVENFEAVRSFQIILMLLSAVLSFTTAYRIYGCRAVALVSASFLCFFGFDYYSGTGIYGYLLTEPLTLFSIQACLLGAVLILQRGKLTDYLLTGFFLALAMLTRPSNLFFPVFLGLFLFGAKPCVRTLKNVLFMLAVIAILVAPWTLRNYIRFNRLIALSAPLSGVSVFSAAIIKNPDFIPYPDSAFEDNHHSIPADELQAARNALRGLYRVFAFGGSGGEELYHYDDELKSIGFKIIQRDYLAFLEKWFYRLLGHWHLGDVAKIISGISRTTAPTGWVKIMLKGALIGLFLFSIYYYRQNPLIYLILLFPVYNTLVYTPFTPQIRYALPARGCVIIILAAGVCALGRAFLVRDGNSEKCLTV